MIFVLFMWSTCGVWWFNGWWFNATSEQRRTIRLIECIYVLLFGPLNQFRKVFQ